MKPYGYKTWFEPFPGAISVDLNWCTEEDFNDIEKIARQSSFIIIDDRNNMDEAVMLPNWLILNDNFFGNHIP